MNINILNNLKEIKKKTYNDKINEFIKWYKQNEVKEILYSVDKDNYKNFENIDKLKDFIDLVAIWFELIVNDDLVYHSIIRNNFEKLYNVVSTSYNKHLKNKYLLIRPKYKEMFFDSDKLEYSFDVDEFGKVQSIGGIKDYSKYINKPIKDVIIDMKKNNKNISFNKIIQKIKYYEIKNEQVDRLLDTVIYRIMERGENNLSDKSIGPKRAYLFAKLFERDISIPLKHGINLDDYYLIDFIYSYLINNGNPDIYYYKNNLISKKNTLKELIKEYDKNHIKVNECLNILNKDEKILRKAI